jgi:diguanylate cyclase (GGDEF)-like protein
MWVDPPNSKVTPRVLLIEDSRFCRFLVRRILEAENIELSEALNGESGLQQARDTRPDLILLDLTLPGWDGFETLRRLKSDSVTGSIPVVFLSASDRTAEKAKGLELGAIDFVSKPFEALELHARVRNALRTKYLQDLLEQRAHLDGLTGLGNRYSLEERFRAVWETARQRTCPLTVVIADLDHFKRVNDTYGHRAGDAVLQRAAAVLKDSVRAGDFLARYGGEEFVVLALECDRPSAIVLAERFRRALERVQVTIDKTTISVTASVGVATATDFERAEPVELIGEADRALYHAKSSGRNNVCIWQADRQEAISASQLAIDMAPWNAAAV